MSGFPSDSTIKRRFKQRADLLGVNRSRVTVESRGPQGGTVSFYVYHQERLTKEQIEEIKTRYKEMKLTENPELRADEVKVRVDRELATVEWPFVMGAEYGKEEDVGYG